MSENSHETKEKPFGELQRFVEFLEANADDALAFERLTESDRKELAQARDSLRSAVLEIEKLFERLPYEHLSEHGRDQLWRALGAAWIIGSRGDVADSNKVYIREKQGATARDGKAIGDKQRLEALRHAILACVDNDRSRLNGNRDNLCPRREQVLEELPRHIDLRQLKSNWPGLTTLVTQISALKAPKAPRN
jgi:hypothetical protein